MSAPVLGPARLAEDLAIAFTPAGETRHLTRPSELRACERVALPLALEDPRVAAWARQCRDDAHDVLLAGRDLVGPLLPAAGGPCFECARRQALMGVLPAGLPEAGQGLDQRGLATIVERALASVPWAALAGAVVGLAPRGRAQRVLRLARLAGCEACRRPLPLAEVFYATQLFEIHQGGQA